jgi:hypothetical protein
MTTLTINLTDWPHDTEPRNGDHVAYLVEGIVRRIEDDLIDTASHGTGRSYLHGSREVEVTVTALKRQPVPVQYV